MSAELERAKELSERGKYKKALNALWTVEAGARANLDEAEGLVDLATSLRAHLSGRALTECDELLSMARAGVTRLAVDPRTGARVVVPDCRCLGGSGLDIEPSETVRWDLIFHQEDVRLSRAGRIVSIPYVDLTSLEVGEPAVGDTMRSKTKSAAVRVGTTAAIGVVMLPVALPLLFMKSGYSTGFAIRTDVAELFLLHRSDIRPEEWRMRLSEVFVKITPSPTVTEPAKDALPVGDDKLSQLERLVKLREQGVLSDEEIQRLKADLLADQ